MKMSGGGRQSDSGIFFHVRPIRGTEERVTQSGLSLGGDALLANSRAVSSRVGVTAEPRSCPLFWRAASRYPMTRRRSQLGGPVIRSAWNSGAA